ncbi:protein YgfX [Dokdonella ginsengisoli]|uniref:Protein YgfX n=1 Tax=Dokdonella ginsengisoli TaxID=363846 RepID=A0ABV9QT27_9GAMM
MKPAPAIAFDVRPSRRIGAAVAVGVLLAALAPWATSLPWTSGALLSSGAIAFGALALRRHMRPHFRRAAWRESGWILLDRDGREHAAVLESHVRLGALLSLAFRHAPRARFRLLLAPDNLDADTRRRLILRLARDGDTSLDSAAIR